MMGVVGAVGGLMGWRVGSQAHRLSLPLPMWHGMPTDAPPLPPYHDHLSIDTIIQTNTYTHSHTPISPSTQPSTAQGHGHQRPAGLRFHGPAARGHPHLRHAGASLRRMETPRAGGCGWGDVCTAHTHLHKHHARACTTTLTPTTEPVHAGGAGRGGPVDAAGAEDGRVPARAAGGCVCMDGMFCMYVCMYMVNVDVKRRDWGGVGYCGSRSSRRCVGWKKGRKGDGVVWDGVDGRGTHKPLTDPPPYHPQPPKNTTTNQTHLTDPQTTPTPPQSSPNGIYTHTLPPPPHILTRLPAVQDPYHLGGAGLHGRDPDDRGDAFRRNALLPPQGQAGAGRHEEGK